MASNVGQIANQAAVELTKEKAGKMFCLAGIGGHVESFIESTKGSRRIVTRDGCRQYCAKKTLEHVGLPITDYVVVSEEGIKKTHDFDLHDEDIQKICKKVKDFLK